MSIEQMETEETGPKGNGASAHWVWERADGLLDDAKLMAIRMADREKRRLADNIALRARAVKKAAEPFEDTDPRIAEGINGLARTLTATADHIGESPMTDLVDEVNDLCRRKPLLVLGAAALVGVAAGRFLRAAAEDRRDDPAALDGDEVAERIGFDEDQAMPEPFVEDGP